jgi:CubicO group peptidase (beta-lactamase class C family)
MIVLHRGRIELEAYRNGMTPPSPHIAMSVSKSITSLVTGVLANHGLIDLRAEVIRYMPELAGTAYQGATIQHLLDMQVANSWREDYFGETTEFWRLDVACGWLPPRQEAAPTLFDFLKESHLDGRHGERFQYSSLNPDLLGLIAERVTETRFATVVSTFLWQPAGMEFDADITLDPAGTAVADGGYCITLRDLARTGQIFLNGGRAADRQVVPASWVEECRRPNPKPFDGTSFGADLGGASYHNQWWLFDDRSFALGIHGQMIAVDFKAELVVVFVSSPPEPNNREQRLMQRRIVDALAEALF